jgi:hypothetical protein
MPAQAVELIILLSLFPGVSCGGDLNMWESSGWIRCAVQWQVLGHWRFVALAAFLTKKMRCSKYAEKWVRIQAHLRF